LVRKEPDLDSWLTVNNSAFGRIRKNLKGEDPKLRIKKEILEEIITCLQKGDDQSKIRACKILGSAALQLAKPFAQDCKPVFLEVLFDILLDDKEALKVRREAVQTLASLATAYEIHQVNVYLWVIGRLLDLVRRSASEATLKRSLTISFSRFTLLDKPPATTREPSQKHG